MEEGSDARKLGAVGGPWDVKIVIHGLVRCIRPLFVAQRFQVTGQEQGYISMKHRLVEQH